MFQLTRRQALTTALAGAAATAATATVLPGSLQAKAPRVQTQAPGFYRRNVGNMQVTALLDGYLDIGIGLWKGIEPATVQTVIKDSFLPGKDGTIRIGITSWLMNMPDRLVLVDSGSANLFGPTAGKFPARLREAGFQPEQVDEILLTHMHPDHVADLLVQGRAAFPNARLHVNSTELDFWASEKNMKSAPDSAKGWYDLALNIKAIYKDRLQTFTGERQVLPGVTSIPLPGHTPGMTGFRVEAGGEDLLFWGDACGVAPVQFRYPDAGLVFDVDGATGKKTRKRLLDMAAQERILNASAHCPWPGLGYVDRSQGAFAWVPDSYSYAI